MGLVLLALFVALVIVDLAALAYALHDLRQPLFLPPGNGAHDDSHQDHYHQDNHDSEHDVHGALDQHTMTHSSQSQHESSLSPMLESRP